MRSRRVPVKTYPLSIAKHLDSAAIKAQQIYVKDFFPLDGQREPKYQNIQRAQSMQVMEPKSDLDNKGPSCTCRNAMRGGASGLRDKEHNSFTFTAARTLSVAEVKLKSEQDI